MRPRAWHTSLNFLLIAVLALALLYPIALTIRGGFASDVATGSGFTLSHIALIFQDPVTRGELVNSTIVATLTTALAILIALPLALISARHRFPFKGLLNAFVLVPLILPPFVGAIGARAILGHKGMLNALLGTDWDILGDAKLLGVVVLQALSLYPIIFLNASAALANLDPALDEAAQSLGASPIRRLFRITLPLIRSGVFAGATIVFIWSFTELGTPLMFDYYQVLPVRIFNGLREVSNSAQPYAATVVLLAAAILFYVLGKRLFAGRAYPMYAKASRAASEKPLTGLRGWLATGAFALVSFLAVLPHLGVVLTSISATGQWYDTILPSSFTADHYRQALGAADSFRAIVNSLKYASVAVVVDIILGIAIAYLLVRGTGRGKATLDALCMLPLAVPGLVLAFGYVAVSQRWPMGRTGPLGDMILGADPNPIPLLIIAYAVRRLPYIVRSTVAGLEQTSGELEEAAANLGASRWTTIRRVTVPLILANLIAGSLLVFSFSMLEVSDSLILAQQARHYPVTRAILSFMERLRDGPNIASAMGVWGMALLTVTLVGASAMIGKKLGSIFRA
ncbi:MAG: ABC transporter permease [Phycisphaerales bacterium]